MKEVYLRGIYSEYIGLRDQKIADLNVILNSPVGVGEHGDLSGTIKKIIQEIDSYDSLISTLNNLIPKEEEKSE